jgi:hypothetical protein
LPPKRTLEACKNKDLGSIANLFDLVRTAQDWRERSPVSSKRFRDAGAVVDVTSLDIFFARTNQKGEQIGALTER